ncbi:uncharacterized protein LOC119769464 [Culex quinquefasciatus]|uniref:uncharacterized protein LOC119769464 n=1 Tax=Culex quinquefasciatus TaxID=7176 RepID=UPI0018E39325|nr:uncharacterized protein LOC119769464 [Culex quinquefasciatus]
MYATVNSTICTHKPQPTPSLRPPVLDQQHHGVQSYDSSSKNLRTRRLWTIIDIDRSWIDWSSCNTCRTGTNLRRNGDRAQGFHKDSSGQIIAPSFHKDQPGTRRSTSSASAAGSKLPTADKLHHGLSFFCASEKPPSLRTSPLAAVCWNYGRNRSRNSGASGDKVGSEPPVRTWSFEPAI